ncbi:ABC transporter substrate-binding protein [Vallitalea okinawensis]|uniref:ABC transporter substrate-binding protein n=1 Tax=Vallitalea okinawensis TaxID=2078660 RepID=UPI00130048C5|nr:ABC transporter substrate-binding protein [Vallitalea okinawensis]
MKKIALLLVLGFLLTGCYGLDSSKQLVVRNMTTNEEEHQIPIRISLMHSFTDYGGLQWVIKTTQAYTQHHPEVEFDIYSVTPENYDSVLQQHFASGTMPDLYYLSNIFDNITYIEKDFAINLTHEPFMRHNFVVGSLKGVEYRDQIWAVPIDWNGYGVIYNKDVFKYAGIDRIPSTYSELIETCEKLQDTVYTPIAAGFNDNYTMMNDIQVDLSQSSYYNNTDWRISIEKNLYMWQDNFFKLSDALERFAQRLNYYNPDMFETSWYEATRMVANGEAAMIMGDFKAIDTIRSHNEHANLGMFMYPWSDDISKNNFPIKTMGGLVANNQSDNKTYLLDIMEHFSTIEVGNLTQKYKKTISVVAGVDEAIDPAYNELIVFMDLGRKSDFSKFTSKFKREELNDIFNEELIRFIYDEEHNVEATVKQLDVESQKLIGNLE